MNGQTYEPLSVIAGHLVNYLSGVRRAAAEQRVQMAPAQVDHLSRCIDRLLGDLRGPAREQQLAVVSAIFALKILRMEIPLCKRT